MHQTRRSWAVDRDERLSSAVSWVVILLLSGLSWAAIIAFARAFL
jgi:hypothetical protein